MATKTYTVHRSMHGDGRDYEPGDTRELTEADAASLVEMGALALEGEEPLTREPAVRHTFGTDPGTAPADYTTATGEGVIVGQPAATQTDAAPAKVSAKKAQATT